MTADIVLIPGHLAPTGRTLVQNGRKLSVLSECCSLSIMDSGMDSKGAYAMFCNGCEKRLAANPERWSNAVYNISRHTGTDDDNAFKRWAAYMFGLENVEIEVIE